MFYAMKSLILFVAASLILVGATIAVTLPDAVQAEPPTKLWCFNDGAACVTGDKKDCQNAAGFDPETDKCKKTTVG